MAFGDPDETKTRLHDGVADKADGAEEGELAEHLHHLWGWRVYTHMQHWCGLRSKKHERAS